MKVRLCQSIVGWFPQTGDPSARRALRLWVIITPINVRYTVRKMYCVSAWLDLWLNPFLSSPPVPSLQHPGCPTSACSCCTCQCKTKYRSAFMSATNSTSGGILNIFEGSAVETEAVLTWPPCIRSYRSYCERLSLNHVENIFYILYIV